MNRVKENLKLEKIDDPRNCPCYHKIKNESKITLDDLHFTRRGPDASHECRETFIDYHVNECGGDERVISFIADIRFHGAIGVGIEDSVEAIRSLFENGYCYYFAKILETAFPGGLICVCYRFGHIVYVYDEVAYDISGVTDSEYDALIPIDEFGSLADGFLHIPGVESDATKEKVDAIAEKYKKEKGEIFALSQYTQEIVKRCNVIVNEDMSGKYAKDVIRFKEKEAESKSINISNASSNDKMREYCLQEGLSWRLIQRLRCRKVKEYMNQHNMITKELKTIMEEI